MVVLLIVKNLRFDNLLQPYSSGSTIWSMKLRHFFAKKSEGDAFIFMEEVKYVWRCSYNGG